MELKSYLRYTRNLSTATVCLRCMLSTIFHSATEVTRQCIFYMKKSVFFVSPKTVSNSFSRSLSERHHAPTSLPSTDVSISQQHRPFSCRVWLVTRFHVESIDGGVLFPVSGSTELFSLWFTVLWMRIAHVIAAIVRVAVLPGT